MDGDIDEIEAEIGRIEGEISALSARKRRLVDRKRRLEEERFRDKALKLSMETDWESPTGFVFSPKISKTLASSFHLAKFRPLQLSAINATLAGNDVMVVMPTGGGKSLCYQLPALVDGSGFTLVVTPLVSLMEDQVMALKKLGISAEYLNSSTSKEAATNILNAMVDTKSPMRLVYVTPEKLSKSKRFMAKLQKSYSLDLFNRLAIDEVHCCSTWGHDFRPDYKFLGVVRNLCPKVPIMGLTATSTAQVTEDVKSILSIQSCLVFRSKLNRPNLYYEVRPKPANHEHLLESLESLLTDEFSGQSGIIYTLTIKDVETLTKDLLARGLKVGSYHANLEPEDRTKVHKKWLSGVCQAVIATIAFGMGIDKPDVRFVVHHCMSKSMENYYQESGRAGRDDKAARCILYYRFNDISRLSTMVFTEKTGLEKLYGMIAYCLDRQSCRRRMIADHFGEQWAETDCSSMCDSCRPSIDSMRSKPTDVSDIAEACRQILARAKSADTRVTALKLLDAVLGKGATSLKLPGWQKPNYSLAQVECMLAKFIMGGQLMEDFHYTPYSTISYILPGPVPVAKPLTLDIPTDAPKKLVK